MPFACLVDLRGHMLGDAARQRYSVLRSGFPGRTAAWLPAPSANVLVYAELSAASTVIAQDGDLIVVGDVRLDNHCEVARWLGRSPHAPDIALVAAVLAQYGPTRIRELLGDFAFVAWNAASRQLIAARDAFGVKPLYYRSGGDTLLFSSHCSALAEDNVYDEEFIADFLLGGFRSHERTIFVAVKAVAPGTLIHIARSGRVASTFWSPWDVAVDGCLAGPPQYDTFRALLAEAVQSRIGAPGTTWAQLSGGLDSSSVVSIAQYLAEHHIIPSGLAGTVSVVHDAGGDEREYSDAVLQRYRVPNVQIADFYLWQDDEAPPPLTDTPYPAYPSYARDRRIGQAVLANGGTILLTGEGSDQYLTGSYYFFADWLVRGKLGGTIRELTRWSILARRSFWPFAFHNAVLPMLPGPLKRRFMRMGVPVWLDRRFASRARVAKRLPAESVMDGRLGAKYSGEVAYILSNTWLVLQPGVLGEMVELRHPFLYRPLVEFCLRLPPHMRTRPTVRKWVLREAMRGILPEPVRLRQGKGMADGYLVKSLTHQHAYLTGLLSDPILAQLGCINLDEFRATVERARGGHWPSLGSIANALSLETWLQRRSGRWTAHRRTVRQMV